MAARLIMRKVRNQVFTLDDYLTMFAIGCVMWRTSVVPVVTVYGTNSLSISEREAINWTKEEVFRRTVGSRLALANRVVYQTYLWVQKTIVLLLYERMFDFLTWPNRIIKLCWIALAGSYLAALVATFTDCFPVYLYWQVLPDPGPCVEGETQLWARVGTNVATDTILIALPLPLLMGLRQSLMLRLQLIGLFSIGITLIIIALLRMPAVRNTDQITRNMLGSLELFFAAFVANVPTLYTLRRRNPHNLSSRSNYNFHSSRSNHASRNSRVFINPSVNADDRMQYKMDDIDKILSSSVQHLPDSAADTESQSEFISQDDRAAAGRN
ncbi:hypothetical protein FQN57_000484 [Myotisia sp. PD_48]|nr:hypothetical protein FQN57_000484 [Myotisia sp. PD_48]